MATTQPSTPAPGPGWTNYNGSWLAPGMSPSTLSKGAAPTTASPSPTQPVDNGALTPSGAITDTKGVANTAAPVGGSIAQGAPATVAQSFQQALVNRLNPQAITAQSSEVAPAIQANKLSEQRNFERNRQLLAERAAANGQDLSGGFETNLLGLSQDRAAREGQFAGSAIQQAQLGQDQNTRSALGTAAGLLGGNANLAQQQQLADLDAEIRRAALAQQGQLGNADINLRSQLGQGQLNLGLLSALLGNDYNNRALSQQGYQFGAGLDQAGLLGLLGGL